VADEQLDHLVSAVQHAQVRGRLHVLVSRVGVGAAVQQQPDDVLVAELRGHVHRAVGRPAGRTVSQASVARNRPLHRRVVSQHDRAP